MPRYYFDVVDGEISVQDPKGPELENIKRAEAKAQKFLTEVAEVTFSDADWRDVITIVGDEALVGCGTLLRRLNRKYLLHLPYIYTVS